MSDLHLNQPNPNDPFRRVRPQGGDAAPWERNPEGVPEADYEPMDDYGMQAEPFAAYDDPMAQQPKQEAYSAWQARQPMDASFLTDEPIPFGAEMQQGGLPLFGQGVTMADDFRAQAGDAPTRLARPVSAQMVNKRTTVERGNRSPFAPPKAQDKPAFEAPMAASVPKAAPAPVQKFEEAISEPVPMEPVRRRRRADRNAVREELPLAPVLNEASSFDPFHAGDSEISEEPLTSERRSAVPGGRYTGARTAMPSARAQADFEDAFPPQSTAHPMTEQPAAEEALMPTPPSEELVRRPARPGRQPMRADAQPAELEQQPQQGMRAPQRPPMRADAQPAELEQQPQQGMRAPQRPPMRPDAQPAEFEQQPQQGMRAPQRPPMRPDAQSAGRFERPMRSERPPMPNEEPMANPMQSRTDEQFARPPMKRPPMPQGGQAEGAMRPERQPMAPDGRRQPAQRPAPRMEDEQPKRKQLPNAERYARDVQERNPHASVDRRLYDFEEEGEEAEPRRGGVLLPIVIVLLVIGGLLAGICLPDWASVNGGIGTALNGVKTSIVSAVTSVKEMIFPTEAPIKSFSATASEGAAPTQVVFNVQTTKNVAGIRIADDLGKNVYTNAYNADTEASGEVINNSNVLLWKPAYTVEDAYNGGYTVYVQKKDGTESEGMRSEGTVTIAAAKPAMPAIQGFECDTLEGAVPATLGFTIETSTEVTGVRIVDSYNNPVATLFDTDGNTADSSMTENGELRRWSIFEDVTAAYAGNYTLQYQTSSDDLSFTPSDYDVQVSLSAQAPQTDAADPTAQNPLSDEAMADNEGMAEGQPEGDAVMAIAQTDAEEPIAMPEASEQVAAEPTLEPTLAPTPEPEPTATPIPATTPLAKLEAAADEAASPESIKLDATLYKNGKPTKTFEREKPISMLSPFTTSDEGSNYAVWKQAGVLTFRSGPMRQNASYGTAEVENKTLTQLWTQPVGSMKVNKATLYGVGYPGQPVIVKWPTEVRQRMAMEDAMKQVTALKEVIVSGQDGNIYFYNLLDGTATREPIKLGAPSAGGLSVATNGTPILGVGQSHSKLANKNVKNGYHLINLLTNKKEELYECDGKDKNSNYTGVLGAALFESKTGTMFFGSQNGVLYSVALGSQEEAYDHQSGKITLGSEKQGYKTLAARQSEKNTNINASIAMYNNYIYYADAAGIVQCVNANTLQPVWAVNTGDAVSATPALDMENESTVALYTGNTILNMGKKGTCTIRKLDALTGAEKWQYAVPELGYTTEYDIGCMASPVVGQQSIQDLVIFTVSKGAAGSAVIALDKQSGTVAWETALPSTTVSSPVAVYNESGDAWILQAEKDGNVNLLDAKSGALLNTLKLDGEIEASPAVYGNLMIIGTTGKNKGSVVCVKID